MGYDEWGNPTGPGKAGPASFNVRDANGSVELVTGPPPLYPTERALPPRTKMDAEDQPWWKPKYWRKRTWAIVAVLIAIIIAAAVVAGVLVSKANQYPEYSALSYSLQDTYEGTSFFDNFDYFTGYDPAEGFVHYVPKEQATSLNLTYASDDSAFLRVDTSVGPEDEPNASTGRFSVRVSSKTQYNEGLFIFDVKHTPFGCGTWPALWLVDQDNWPEHGEIDIMEAVNQATDGNQMTLHTSEGCTMSNIKRKETGDVLQGNCYNEVNDNAGCGVQGPTDSYGSAYNNASGGIMAMEWRSDGIRIWDFDRNSIPTDITNKSPDPSTWGEAAADFPNTDCNIGNHFKNQSIVMNIDLCGQFAGNVYASSGCPSNCTDYVANNPDAFTNAFWEFGSFEIYQAS
ncbi:glycoside hydrolase family 16 protein [Xylariaceae sp. FL0016]|nr:glycoside hydrolase family 16 protein [Xylariaceae sp. FL0016]